MAPHLSRSSYTYVAPYIKQFLCTYTQPYCQNKSVLLDYLSPKEEGTTILRNVGNHIQTHSVISQTTWIHKYFPFRNQMHLQVLHSNCLLQNDRHSRPNVYQNSINQ
jgi:hypothetical protein